MIGQDSDARVQSQYLWKAEEILVYSISSSVLFSFSIILEQKFMEHGEPIRSKVTGNPMIFKTSSPSWRE